MREVTLMNEITYNKKYRKLDERSLDGDNYIQDTLTLKRKVYNSNELIELTDEQKKLTDKIINNYKNVMKERNINITKEQLNFAEQISQMVAGIFKEDIVIVAPAACGFGKSTIILEYLKVIVEQYKNKEFTDGVIIATDRLDSLREMQEELGQEYTYILEGWNEKICKNPVVLKKGIVDKCCTPKNCTYFNKCKICKQQIEQKKYPILFITNARLREVGIELKSYKKYDNGERKLLLIDEKPEILDSVKVNDTLLSRIVAEIDRCEFENTQDKTDLQDKFKHIRNNLESKMKTLRNKYKRFIVSNMTNDVICKNDEKFMGLWKKYMKNNYKRELDHIHTILTRGGFYVYENNTEFIATVGSKNLKNMFANDFKTIIFDGSSLYDPHYIKMYKNGDIKFLNTLNTRRFNNLKITENIKHKLTKTNFNDKKYLIKACADFVNKKMEIGFNKAYVVTYQIPTSSKITEYFRHKRQIAMLSEDQCHYFGNTKGKNDMKDCNKMFMFGWETLPDYEYAIQFLSIVPDWDGTLKICNELEKAEQISELLEIKDRSIEKLNDGREYKSAFNKWEFGLVGLNEFKNFLIVTNFYQEIFRTKLRNYNIDEKIEVEIFKIEYVISEMIKELLNGCNFIVNNKELESFKIAKLMNRKPIEGKKETNAQKLMNYLNSLEKGVIIKTKDIYVGSGLTSNQLKELRKSNKTIKEWFDNKTIKKGTYVI